GDGVLGAAAAGECGGAWQSGGPAVAGRQRRPRVQQGRRGRFRGRRVAGVGQGRRPPLSELEPAVRGTAGRRVRRTLCPALETRVARRADRKSTRLNSSHVKISYAVFCLKKKIYLYNCSTVRLHVCA